VPETTLLADTAARLSAGPRAGHRLLAWVAQFTGEEKAQGLQENRKKKEIDT